MRATYLDRVQPFLVAVTRTWFFRAHPPPDTDGRQGFAFSSGITVAFAKARPKHQKPQTQPARSAWGAPVFQQVVEEVKSNDAMEIDPNAKELHTPPRSTEEKPPKKVKTEPTTPWKKYFTTVANGGAGDCAYIGIAQELADGAGKSHRAKPDDFLPGARLQANNCVFFPAMS